MKAFHADMGRCLCLVFMASAVNAAVFEAANGDPSRSVAVGVEGRIWQTAFSPNAPLKWHWQDGETSARIRVVDHMSGGERVSDVIARDANEPFGSFDPSVPADRATGREYLYDFTLEVFAGAEQVRAETARVAYLPGIGTDGAGSFRLVHQASREWRRVPAVRLAAYDAEWKEETVGQTPTVFSIGAKEAVLPGSSGYFPISPDQLTTTRQTVALSFRAVADSWMSSLYAPGGMMLLLR